MGFSTLTPSNGIPVTVTSGDVIVPFCGVWVARLELDRGDSPIAGPVTIAFGDLSLKGTVRRGTVYQGLSSYFICGGADGWSKTVPAASSQTDTAKLSRIVQDVARLVGETTVLEAGAERQVGRFNRLEDTASRVLANLSPGAWWVETDGVTHIGARSGKTVSPSILDYFPQEKRARVAEESAFPMPGDTLSGDVTGKIATVTHCLTGSIRSDVWLA